MYRIQIKCDDRGEDIRFLVHESGEPVEVETRIEAEPYVNSAKTHPKAYSVELVLVI